MAKVSVVQNIANYFRNIALNAIGFERDLYQLLNDSDVSRAISLMDDNTLDVDNAIKEYNPQLHDIMHRPNKQRKDKSWYKTCKLPRALQRYINEVEVYFLLGNGITFKKEEGDDEAYKLFLDFCKKNRYSSTLRRIKRIAGSETECAKVYNLFRMEETNANGEVEQKVECKVTVVSRSKGYQLRYMFDQYGDLLAFAYGYNLKENGKTTLHWDIQTSKVLYFCKKSPIVGWSVEQYPNPTGRINVILFKQDKAWFGVEPRIARIEELDSKIGDTNNYFADPIALATADVVSSIADPNMPAKIYQVTQGGRFEYVNPPLSSELRDAEKKDLHDSALFDSLTPDLDFEKLKGAGTLTGTAIDNSMAIGYIKRDINLEIYDELVDRDINVIIGVLKELYPNMSAKLDTLVISHEFQKPFAKDNQSKWSNYVSLYAGGLVSLETAVEQLALTDAPEEEIDRIRMAAQEKLMAQDELDQEKGQELTDDAEGTKGAKELRAAIERAKKTQQQNTDIV